MSEFTDVDASRDPQALLDLLDRYDQGLAAMKAYMTGAAARAVPGGRVVDVGCGSGPDLVRLAGAGLRAIGVDPSAVMLAAAQPRLAASGDRSLLVRADGLRLPFRAGSLDGCRMERVLQHVTDPGAVLAEAARVVRPGGFLAVFEPDWTSVVLDPGLPAAVHRRVVSGVRHPDIGARLGDLADEAGWRVDDEVVERSRAERLAGVPFPVVRHLEAAAEAGLVTAEEQERALHRLLAEDGAGRFRATWTKVLVVATRR